MKSNEERIAELERRVEELERGRTVWPALPVPTFPQPVPFPAQPNGPMGPVTGLACGKCGLRLDGPLGFVCLQPDCPSGLGGAWCNAGLLPPGPVPHEWLDQQMGVVVSVSQDPVIGN